MSAATSRKDPGKSLGVADRSSSETGKEMSQSFKIASVITFYFIVSMSVVFLNKFILSYSAFKFPFPIFVSWFQMIVALVCIIFCGELSKYTSFQFIPAFEFNIDTARTVAPLTGIFVAMILFNNLCLQYVEVSFYQVARSLTIVFNIFFTYTILGKTTSMRSMQCCGVVVIGYILGSVGEVRFSWAGLIFGLLSSVFVSVYSIYVKRTLDYLENNEGRLMIYNTVLACIFLFPFVFFSGELDYIRNVPFLNVGAFWAVMVLTAVFGFLINIATFLQIKFTSPLTNTISGTAKACVQTVLGTVFFGNEISFLNGLGTLISISGSLLYSLVRFQEMQAASRS
eukprot:ANDGO_08178.mRNA.1 GDP-fucose transporter 1